MARDWEISDTLAMIQDKMAKYEAINTADVPFCMTREMTVGTDPKTGKKYNRYQWIVDIHVRIPRVTEFTVEASAPTLSAALRKACKWFNNETANVADAAKSNDRFGISV